MLREDPYKRVKFLVFFLILRPMLLSNVNAEQAGAAIKIER